MVHYHCHCLFTSLFSVEFIILHAIESFSPETDFQKSNMSERNLF